MSIERLISSCIQPGTAYSEQGKSVSIARRGNEFVLLFQTDNDVARSVLGITRSCDVTFFYMRHQERPILVFCELKGRNVSDAADQISSTLLAVRTILRQIIGRGFPQNGDIRALVVRTGSAPHNQSAIQESFFRRTGVELLFARNEADLRDYLS
jgi:hypothetical protein